MRKLWTTLIGLLLFALLLGQTTTRDSLRKIPVPPYPDSAIFNYYHNLGYAWLDANADSANFYADKAANYFEESDYIRQGKILYLRGRAANIKYEDRQAMQFFEKLVELNKKHPHLAKQKLMELHSHLASNYSFTGNIPKALLHLDTARLYLDEDDHRQTLMLNHRLSTIYNSQGEYQVALDLHLKNLAIAREKRDSTEMSYAYYDLAYDYDFLKLPDSSIYYLNLGLPLYRKLGDKRMERLCLACLGINYIEKEAYEYSLTFFRQWEQLNNELGEDDCCGNNAYMAVALYKTGKTQAAFQYSQRALEPLKNAANTTDKSNALLALIEIFEAQEDYESAFRAQNQLLEVRDSLNSQDNRRVLREMEVAYKTKEQQNIIEKQNATLAQQRAIVVAVLATAILLLSLLFLGWRNLRQKQKLNQRLLELDELKSQFFANISHELRTPLTLILAPLEKALKMVKGKILKENLSLVLGNAQKLSSLINEVLDLSKLESGKMELQKSAVNLYDLTRRIFFSFQSLAQIRQLELDFRCETSKDLGILVDIPKFEKILNNLTSNSIKYSKPGGTIKLSINSFSEKGKNWLQFQMADSGIGISEEDLPKIFDRFYQSGSASQQTGGTGIGLALAKELAVLFGGDLKVESKMGEGSVFIFLMPYEKVEVAALKSLKKPKNSKESKIIDSKLDEILGSDTKILIAEDNPEMAQFLKQHFSEKYTCKIVYDGQEALSLLEKETFDLLITDLMMPLMDGFSLLEKLRQPTFAHKDIPVMMLTARALEQDKLKAFRLGVDDYLTKPFSSAELLARVNYLLENKNSRKNTLEEVSIQAKLVSADLELVKNAEKLVLENLDEPAFSVHDLAKALNYSNRHLERLLKKQIGLSPVAFIRELRLRKAYQMLKSRQFLSVTEVRYEVGMENASYFTRKFKERFGLNPREVLEGEMV